MVATAHASHIVGGEVFYTYLGPGVGANTSRYLISLRLFRDCNQPCGGQTGVACLPTVANIGIFTNAVPFGRVLDVQLPRTSFVPITLSAYPACINVKPPVCYEVATFSGEVTLNNNAAGYRLSYQNCCRVTSANVTSNASTPTGVPGATYEAVMPGTDLLPTGVNSSAVFLLKDTALVCNNKNFTLNFTATDPDGDSLSYAFVAAYGSGNITGAVDQPPNPPPYGNLTYNTFLGYTADQPLGPNVSIDATTGIISGVSPANGNYVVNVLVFEWRNGFVIGQHRKDFVLKVEACDFAAATVALDNYVCKSFTTTFQNLSTSSSITGYLWNFGDPASGVNNTSTQPTPSHTFTDTGTFKIKLTVYGGPGCESSDSGSWHVFPGFVPNFDYVGSCFQTPFQFIDKSTAVYGTVTGWKWDFGVPAVGTDTSSFKNPSYKYDAPGSYNVRLIVGSTKGCRDTIIRPVSVTEKPFLKLPFRDTLICSIDTLPLLAETTGASTVKWTPNYNLSNTNINNPLSWPKDTTVYVISVTEGVCTTSDSIQVNVLDFITVELPPDTTICRGDSIQLRPETHALSFQWSPSAGLNNSTFKYPMAAPQADVIYKLTANLGKCQDRDSMKVKVVPYPTAVINPVGPVCFGELVQLQGTAGGSRFEWSPASLLTGTNTLKPVANTPVTTDFVLTVYDTIGCPKPFSDTVTLTVRPPVPAFAGNDTVVVLNQPLQLNASGGELYSWTPSLGLNNPSIPNPVALFTGNPPDVVKYLVTVTSSEGCKAQDDVVVRIFKTNPDIFVPTGFTPNQDGRNDVLKAIPVGIKRFEYFNIYNRWGQLLFSTSDASKGWDGSFSGKDQQSGTYVFTTQGIDYTDKPVVKKGTVVLIR